MSSASNTLDAQVLEKIKGGKDLYKTLKSGKSIIDYAEDSNFNLLLKDGSTWDEASTWADAICKKVLASPQQLTDPEVFKSTVNSILIEYLKNTQEETTLSGSSDDDDAQEALLMLNSKSVYSSVLPHFIGVFLNLALLADYNKDDENIDVVFSINNENVKIELFKDETEALQVEDPKKRQILEDIGLTDSSYQKLEQASINFFSNCLRGGANSKKFRFAIKLGNHVLSAEIDNDDPDNGGYECTFSMISKFPGSLLSNWGGALRVKRSHPPDDQNEVPESNTELDDNSEVDSNPHSNSNMDSDMDSDIDSGSEDWADLGPPLGETATETTSNKQKKAKGNPDLHNEVDIELLNERFHNFARSIPSKSLLGTMEFYETKNKSTRDYMTKLMRMPDDDQNYDNLCSYVACKIILHECEKYWIQNFLHHITLSGWIERTEASGMPPFLFIRFLLYTQSRNFENSNFNEDQKYFMREDELRWNGDVHAYKYLSDHITELKKQANLKNFFAFPVDSNGNPCALAWYDEARLVQKKDRSPAQADALFFYENMKDIKKISILAFGIPVFKAYMSIMRGTRAFDMAQLLTTTGGEDENFKEAFKEHMESVLNPEEKIEEVKKILEDAGEGVSMDDDDVWDAYVDESYTATKDLEIDHMSSWDKYEATKAFQLKVPLAIAELYSAKQREENSQMLRVKIKGFFDSKRKGAKFWETLRKTTSTDLASRYTELDKDNYETYRLKIYNDDTTETESDIRSNPRTFFLTLQDASQDIDKRFNYIVKNLKLAVNQSDAAIKWMTFSNRSVVKTAIRNILKGGNGDFWNVPDGNTPVSDGQSYDMFMLSTFNEEQGWGPSHEFQKDSMRETLRGENAKKYKLAELIRYGVLQSLFLPAFALVANGSSRLTDRRLEKDGTSTMNPEQQRAHSSQLATKAAEYYNDAEEEGIVVTAAAKRFRVHRKELRNLFNGIIQYVLNREVTQNIRAAISGIVL